MGCQQSKTVVKTIDRGKQRLQNKGISVHCLKHQFLNEVLDTDGLTRESKIYEIENLHGDPGVIRKKGANIISPVDGLMGASYVHSLEGLDNVGDATFMLSYSWGYSIGDIIDTLDDFCLNNNQNPKRTYVWICCLCVNQHRVVAQAQEENGDDNDDEPLVNFEDVFKQRVNQIGHVLAMMAPWHSPLYINRVWCIFELYTANESKVDLTIVMPPNQRKDIEEALVGDNAEGVNALYKALAKTKVEEAQASVEADRVSILSMVKESPGYTALNKRVNELLRKWVTDSIDTIVKRRKEDRLLKKIDGNDNSDDVSYARFCRNVGQLFWKNGELDQALTMCREAVAIFEARVGSDDLETARSYSGIGVVLGDMGEYTEGLAAHMKALAVRKSVLGENHEETATSISHIGFIKQQQGEFDKGLEYHQKALKIRQNVLGTSHADTAESYNNCGALYFDMREYDSALSSYNEAMKMYRSLFGPDHPDVAMVHNNIGRIYFAQGENDAALEEYHKALSIVQSASDEDEYFVGTLFYNIGICYDCISFS